MSCRGFAAPTLDIVRYAHGVVASVERDRSGGEYCAGRCLILPSINPVPPPSCRARFMKIDQEREYDHSHDRSTGANTSDHDNATAGPSSSPQFRSPISNTPLDGDLGYRPFHDLSVPSPGHAASVLDVEAHSYAIDTGFGESQSPFGVGSVYDPAMTASVGDSAVSRPYSLPSLGQEYTAQGSTPSEFERPQGEAMWRPRCYHPMRLALTHLAVPPPRPFWLVKKQSNMLTDMASPSSSSSIKGKGKERLDLEEMLPRHSALLVNELFFDYVGGRLRAVGRRGC